MNTEPPNGDDLQRMLVSMKREVLTRADAERPRGRRHSRIGIGLAVIGLVAVGTASGALALDAVQQQQTAQRPAATHSDEPRTSRTPAQAPFTPTPAPSRTTPPTTPGPTAVALDPDRKVCEQIVPVADHDRLFGSVPLFQGGSVVGAAADTEWPHPTDPALSFLGDASLYCLWRDPRSDVSGLAVTIGTAAPERLAARADLLVQQGGSCEEQPDGQVCRATFPVEGYPVDQDVTFSVRGDTYIEVSQTNFPTSGLLDAIDEAGVVDTVVGDAPRR